MDWEAFYNAFRRPDFIPGYEIENRLGGGAFGDVYKARKSSIGKPYAIKFLKVENDDQQEAVERELDQVRHFAAIDHPNLVTIEDLGVVMDVPYLIMGYAGEETLAKRFKRGDLGPVEALRSSCRLRAACSRSTSAASFTSTSSRATSSSGARARGSGTTASPSCSTAGA